MRSAIYRTLYSVQIGRIFISMLSILIVSLAFTGGRGPELFCDQELSREPRIDTVERGCKREGFGEGVVKPSWIRSGGQLLEVELEN